ncbi:hypothetical protein [Nostoc sp. FACHB-190]|nr:hypothetical protein [Nostoc sp. FACHB-190]MBD2301192.1 hypothetical protein [Nostoc sp. FACHB-190]
MGFYKKRSHYSWRRAIAFVLLLYCSYLLLLKQERYYKVFQTLQNRGK